MHITGGPSARKRWFGVAAAAMVLLALAACSRRPTTPPVTTRPTDPTTPTSRPGGGGTQPVTATIRVSGNLDGGGRRYIGAGQLGSGGDGEGKDPIFLLSDGATISNVVIGAPGADGIHCTGSCTIRNVVWEDVLDDAATFKGTSASQTMVIDGGSARRASDKVFQHNGPGTMIIRNFQVQDFGKLYRSCGNCSSQHRRNVRIENVTATGPGKVLAGINTNYGDTATFSNVTIRNDPDRDITPCEAYRGTTSGEPSKIGDCPYPASQVVWR
jgi:hypothetical protein